MTRDVLCVRPDLSIGSLVDLFVQHGFKAVPVLDEKGALVGIVRESDLLLDQYESDGAAPSDVEVARCEKGMHEEDEPRTVADVMSPLAFEVQESTPITQIAALMAFEGVHQIVVRGLDGRVTGVICASDLLYWVARSDGYSVEPRRHVLGG